MRGEFRQAEIEDLGLPALGDEDIRRLDVAVHNSAGVRRIESVRDLDPQFEQLFSLQRTALDHVFQGRALQIFHGDESFPVLLADVVDGADIGMVQGGSRLGFALEAAEGLRIFGDVIGQKLQRDEAVQSGVFSFVDHAHPATAEFLNDAVVGDGLADHLGDAWLSGRFILRTRLRPVNEWQLWQEHVELGTLCRERGILAKTLHRELIS